MSHSYTARHTAANFGTQQSKKAKEELALQTLRKRYIKAVKTAQRQLGWDDSIYRAMLEAHTGQTSSTKCSPQQLGVVLDYMRRAGAINPKGTHSDGRTRQVPVAERQALMKKVHALLTELRRTTGETYSMAYADAICERNHWCTRVDFANPQTLHLLVGALSRTLRTKSSAASYGSAAATST